MPLDLLVAEKRKLEERNRKVNGTSYRIIYMSFMRVFFWVDSQGTRKGGRNDKEDG